MQIKSYLGRPWKEFSRTIIMESFIDDLIQPQGWLPWNESFAFDTLFYSEFKNRGPGSSKAQRVKWPGVKELSKKRINRFTPGKFIIGDSWISPTGVPYNADFMFRPRKDDSKDGGNDKDGKKSKDDDDDKEDKKSKDDDEDKDDKKSKDDDHDDGGDDDDDDDDKDDSKKDDKKEKKEDSKKKKKERDKSKSHSDKPQAPTPARASTLAPTPAESPGIEPTIARASAPSPTPSESPAIEPMVIPESEISAPASSQIISKEESLKTKRKSFFKKMFAKFLKPS